MTSGILVPYFSQLEGQRTRFLAGTGDPGRRQFGGIVRTTVLSGRMLRDPRQQRTHVYSGEVVGFRGNTVLTMPLEKPSGVRYGDAIFARGERPSLAVGEDLLGRVIDGAGRPLDCRGRLRCARAPRVGRLGAVGAGAPAHSRAAGLRRSRHRCLSHLRPRTAGGHLWRQRRRQEHADRHDGPRHRRRPDGAGAGWRARARSRRIPRSAWAKTAVAVPWSSSPPPTSRRCCAFAPLWPPPALPNTSATPAAMFSWSLTR